NASRKKAKALCRKERSLRANTAFASTPLPVPPPQGGRERCGTDLRISNAVACGIAKRSLPHHINQNPIRIGDPVLAHGHDAREQLLERRTLFASTDRRGSKPRIVSRDALDV